MPIVKTINWRKVAILFALGVVGILSAIPLVPALIAASGQEPPLPMFVIQVLSTLQSSLILLAMVVLGAYCSPRVSLRTPLVDAWLQESWSDIKVVPTVLPAVAGGILGGLAIVLFSRMSMPHLPPVFIAKAEIFSPPLYTRLLYGGITEELLIRWGLMSFFVWGFSRLGRHAESSPRPVYYVLGIVLSSLIFAAGHLPAVSLLSPALTAPLVLYIIVGNSLFGLIAGYLFWKRGLESAIMAHMLAHLVMALLL